MFQGDVEVGGSFVNPGPGGFNVLNGTSSTDGVKGVFDAGDSETEMEDLSVYLADLDGQRVVVGGRTGRSPSRAPTPTST